MGIIRLLLALSVVATHCGAIFGFKLVGGQIAVQSFYVISGFYMSLILNNKYVGINKSYRLFITNRFFRLYPIYWVVLLLTVLVLVIGSVTKGTPIGPFEYYHNVTPGILPFIYLLLSHLIILGQGLVLFLGINTGDGSLFFTSDFWQTHPPLYAYLLIPQAWTLGLELMFYLIAPFILRRGPKLVLILIISSLLLRIFIYNYLGFEHDPWTYRFFPTEFMFFLLGYFSYQVHLKLATITISKRVNIFILAGMIVFTFVYPFLPSLKFNHVPFSLKECFYFSCIVLGIPILFKFLKNSRLDNKIGELSYPVYISHMFILMICNMSALSFLKNGWVLALITIAFSYLLNRLIASPMESYRQSRLRS